RSARLHLCVQVESAEASGLKHCERNLFGMAGSVFDGAQNLSVGVVECFFRIFAFYRIIEDCAHPLCGKGLDCRLTAFNGLSSTKMFEYRFSNDSLDGQAHLQS